MSNNPQWKSFQPPPEPMNHQDSIIDYKNMTAGNGKPSQAFNYNRSTSNSRFGQEFPMLQEKSLPFSNGLFGSSSTTHTSPRFPPIGTFSIDTNNVYNTNSSGDSSMNAGLFSSSTGGSSVSNGNASSNNTYNNDSNSSNLGTRETGIIEKLLHSYGFIQCCERQARLFFHFSQFSGNIEHLKIGDPVEFEMTYDRRTGKPIASAVTKIAPEVVMSEERVTGTVTTEVRGEGSSGDTMGRISYENRGECFFLPYTKDDVEGNVILKAGDRVSFQIATNNRGNLGACHVRLENPAHPVKYQGVVCSLKDSFGFIERADVVKEIFFHFSEAKTKEELRLGDDVEYTIQTRNGKEVACNITKLPPGTVIFEDLKPDTLKGQVTKAIDKNLRTINEPLPGRITYKDAKEIKEISFSEKDQMGDFTLRYGDWVKFQIATDRRDALDRATQIVLLDESFQASGEKREQGVVVSLKEGFGFLRCVEREQRLFFHFNEILDVDKTTELQVGDEFEFTVIQDPNTNSYAMNAHKENRHSAIRMKWLPSGTVQFENKIECDLVGTITKEIPNSWASRSPVKSSQNGDGSAAANGSNNEAGLIGYVMNGGVKKTIVFYSKDCDVRHMPRMGDKVKFDIHQVKRTKEFIAANIEITQSATQNGIKPNLKTNSNTVYQGFIAALKDGFGFIETMQHDKEVFFHFSNFEGDSNTLELGQEVEYNLGTRGNSGSCSSAENVKIIPKGSVTLPPVHGDILDGVVVRPLRSVNPDQTEYSGLIRIRSEEDLLGSVGIGNGNNCGSNSGVEYEFGIMGLMNKRELLQVGDQVQLQVDSTGRAANIVAIRKKLKATVDAIKGHFGFLTYEVEEGKKLFFHMTEVKDNVTLNVGDTVEFVLVTNHRTGKSSACNVVKVCDVQARPERLISRLRTVSLEETGPRISAVRQPKGPDGSKGFSSETRPHRSTGVVLMNNLPE